MPYHALMGGLPAPARPPRRPGLLLALAALLVLGILLLAAGGCASAREGVDAYRATHQPVLSLEIAGGRLCLCAGIEKTGAPAEIETREGGPRLPLRLLRPPASDMNTADENPYDALAARLEGATRTIPRILAWLWGLLAGAFVCGLWVALVDYRQGRTEEKVEELRREDTLADLRLRSIETAAAASAAKLDAINETLTRIDRRLNP